MNLRDLEYFNCLCKTKNFTETAKSLISSGLGIGIMINMAVKNVDSIKKVPLREPILFYISLVIKKNHYMTLDENKITNVLLCKN